MPAKTVSVGPGGSAGGFTYASLKDALVGEAAIIPNLVANTCVLTFECYAMEDTAPATTGSAFTANASYYPRIVAPGAARHPGKWDDTKYRLVVTGDVPNAGGLTLLTPYTRVEGLQIKRVTSNTYQGIRGIQIGGSGVRVGSCLVWHVLNHANCAGNSIDVSYANASVYNTVVWSTGSAARNNIQGEHNGFSIHQGSLNLSNCTASGWYRNYCGSSSGSATVRNCISQGAVGASFGIAGSTSGSDYNLSDKADALGVNSINSRVLSFVDKANGDFHLAAADADIIGMTDPSGGMFLDDIDGVVRTGPWNIGADQYVSGGGGGGENPPPVVSNPRRRVIFFM